LYNIAETRSFKHELVMSCSYLLSFLRNLLFKTNFLTPKFIKKIEK